MGKSTINLDDRLYGYLLEQSLREHPELTALRAETDKLEMRIMQISADQGQFMALLVKMLNAKNIIEIGTFTGYSALSMALSLPDDGKIIACDISVEWTSIAKRFWQRAGVEKKIDLRLAPALDTLSELERNRAGEFDFAFIDADKKNQWAYYQHCLNLMRPGGVIAVDNVLWGGSVADLADQSDDTHAIRDFNQRVHADDRIDISMVPIGDGLTLARKK